MTPDALFLREGGQVDKAQPPPKNLALVAEEWPQRAGSSRQQRLPRLCSAPDSYPPAAGGGGGKVGGGELVGGGGPTGSPGRGRQGDARDRRAAGARPGVRRRPRASSQCNGHESKKRWRLPLPAAHPCRVRSVSLSVVSRQRQGSGPSENRGGGWPSAVLWSLSGDTHPISCAPNPAPRPPLPA